MNILVATAECAPFAKTGGLADVTSTLPIEWEKAGQNPIIVMPKYSQIDIEKYGFKSTHLVVNVPMGEWTEFGALWYGTLPNSKVPVYLIENDDYFSRPGIYGDGEEYPDNDRRFIFLSRAVFEVAKALKFKPDIINSHDFHTAYSLAFLKSHYSNDPLFSNTAGILTIHNLAYQGWWDPKRSMYFSQFGMKEFYPGSWFEHKNSINSLKTGIMFADKITTVSPNYAKEIRYPYFSEGLQTELNIRGEDLIGILNGANYDDWDPKIDEHLYAKYDIEDIAKKNYNKHKFLKEKFGLKEASSPDLPLVGMVTRLAEQKGIDILMIKLESWLATGRMRFAMLGSGEQKYHDYFDYLAAKYPKKIFVYIGYDNDLSHKIIAASDYLIMPSRFEPCGLTQMYALKYGTIPIVRQTGGLVDTVKEYDHTLGSGQGFLFFQYNADDLAYSVRRALSIYKNQPHWDIIRKNAMESIFSSKVTALKYIKVFEWALQKVRG